MAKGLKKIDLANALGVHASLVSRYTAQGMPTSSVAAALEWKQANVRPRVKAASNEQTGLFDYDQARAKREHFAAMQAEAAARKELGQLCELSEVNAVFAKMGTMIRLTMEGWPAMLAPRLAGLPEAQVLAVLADEVERVLHNMSKTAQAFSDAARYPDEGDTND